MDVKLEKWGDDLALPLPIALVEKFGLKDGDFLNLSEETLRRLFGKTKEAKPSEGEE